MESCKAIETPMQTKEKFSKDDGSPKMTENLYKSLIGCLMYLTASRLDIVQAVSLLSRFMDCASEEHMQAAKRILSMLKELLIMALSMLKLINFSWLVFLTVIGQVQLMI